MTLRVHALDVPMCGIRRSDWLHHETQGVILETRSYANNDARIDAQRLAARTDRPSRRDPGAGAACRSAAPIFNSIARWHGAALIV
jgi:hypothetical protein